MFWYVAIHHIAGLQNTHLYWTELEAPVWKLNYSARKEEEERKKAPPPPPLPDKGVERTSLNKASACLVYPCI